LIKEPETGSRFLGNLSYKTTQMLREINFKVFRKLLRKRKLKIITCFDENEGKIGIPVIYWYHN
jgi:hypothetical protein